MELLGVMVGKKKDYTKIKQKRTLEVNEEAAEEQEHEAADTEDAERKRKIKDNVYVHIYAHICTFTWVSRFNIWGCRFDCFITLCGHMSVFAASHACCLL